MVGKMTPIDGRRIQDIGVGFFITLFYAIYFWRIFKKNPGNRVVECGIITVVLFLAMVPLSRLGDIPDWFFGTWIILVALLCFSTLFFVVQRVYRAFRRRKRA
jgi:hypothetical protein